MPVILCNINLLYFYVFLYILVTGLDLKYINNFKEWTMRKSIVAMAAAVSVLALSNSARAENTYNPYVALSYNYSDVSAKEYKPYYNSGTVSLGSSYNKYFGTEIFYQLSDKYNKRYDDLKTQTSMQAYGLDLYGYLPLFCDQVFSLVGTVGIAEYDISKKAGFVGEGSDKYNDNGIGYRAGAGVQYSFDEHWDVRAIARYVGFDKIDGYDHMMEYTAAVKYNF